MEAGAPPTRTRPARMASAAPDRLTTSPRRTSSASSRRRMGRLRGARRLLGPGLLAVGALLRRALGWLLGLRLARLLRLSHPALQPVDIVLCRDAQGLDLPLDLASERRDQPVGALAALACKLVGELHPGLEELLPAPVAPLRHIRQATRSLFGRTDR